MHKKMMFGLEIECVYKKEKTHNGEPFPLGSKEHPIKISKYWYAQADGSIRPAWDFPYEVELTCVPFEKKDFLKVWTDLTRNVFGNNKLKTTLQINDSCGSHIHISIIDDKKINVNVKNQIQYADYKKDIQGSFTRLPLTYKKILDIRRDMFAILPEPMRKAYFRSYARRITPRRIVEFADRYLEWNKCFRYGGVLPYHAEFRSPAFRGVKTWLELRNLYSKTFNILEKHLLRKSVDESASKSFIIKGYEDNNKVVINLQKMLSLPERETIRLSNTIEDIPLDDNTGEILRQRLTRLFPIRR